MRHCTHAVQGALTHSCATFEQPATPRPTMRCPRAWQVALLVMGTGLFLGGRARDVGNATLLLLTNTGGLAARAVRLSPVSVPPLKAAILNTTSDFDTLVHLLSEFMQQPGMDPAVEQRFKQFMAERAAKSYPRLESALDWLLAIYKFIFPFLIISLVAKVQGGDASCAPGVGPAAGPANGSGRLAGFGSAHQLALPPSSSGGGGGGMSVQDRRRQLAVGGSVGRVAKTGSSDMGGSINGGYPSERAGSQSPVGPETPIEGTRLLPVHPGPGQPAGGAKLREWPTIREISAEGF